MTHPTPPKSPVRYSMGLTETYPHEEGEFIYADEALAYANALAKQARLDTKSKAVKLCEDLESGVNTAVMLAPKEHKPELRAQGDVLRKLTKMIKDFV